MAITIYQHTFSLSTNKLTRSLSSFNSSKSSPQNYPFFINAGNKASLNSSISLVQKSGVIALQVHTAHIKEMPFPAQEGHFLNSQSIVFFYSFHLFLLPKYSIPRTIILLLYQTQNTLFCSTDCTFCLIFFLILLIFILSSSLSTSANNKRDKGKMRKELPAQHFTPNSTFMIHRVECF